ncbi:MAG: hypothetical protein CVV22_12650 [Ignavibacteriae bacterium HGW-Ignavibacteriae-1]|jgi:hypothetical protein|nr:MAG: hypothetical protein CVV22_12650 [Ignavibacteriae bacterium HGW-Ignavibacteriae-1]
MSYSKLLAVLFASLLMGFLVTSCTEDGPTDPNSEKPAAPTNLMALSVNETTIHLKYDISSSEQNTLFQDYFLSYWVVGETANPMTMAVAKGVNPIAVTGLSEGKIYEFQLVARYTNNENSAASANVKWSPASRFEKTIYNEDINLFERASLFASGLQIYYGSEDGPRTRTTGNSADWDLGVMIDGSTVKFGSASQLGFNFNNQPQPTFMLTDHFLANAFNDVFDSRAMDDGDRNTKYTEHTVDLTNVTGNQNIIVYVRKYQPGKTRYNYAKIMIVRNPAGGFLYGTAPNRHIKLEISYQKVEDVPYAKTASN